MGAADTRCPDGHAAVPDSSTARGEVYRCTVCQGGKYRFIVENAAKEADAAAVARARARAKRRAPRARQGA